MSDAGVLRNYREQARLDLIKWGREVLAPAMKEDIRRAVALGMTEEEAELLVIEVLMDATRGLRGSPR